MAVPSSTIILSGLTATAFVVAYFRRIASMGA